MFGKRRTEEIKMLVESAEKDRLLYAKEAATARELYMEQASRDREMFVEQLAEIKTLNTLVENETSEEPAIKNGQEWLAAYALNLCTVSISQIIAYNDLIVMEQEYEAILNNLNLENFPKDEALLKILKQILDVVAFFRIQAEEKKLQEEEYKKKVKDAVWSAIPSPSAIIAGGSAGWVGLAVTTAMAVGTGYMNYRKARSNIDIEKRRKDWELQKSAMEQFDGLRRELFDTSWRLAETYNFDDKYRLTARQIDQYNNILEDPDALRRYERLEYVQDCFIAYPPFWYYLGHAAAEVCTNNTYSEDMIIEYRNKALCAYFNYLNCIVGKPDDNPLKGGQINTTYINFLNNLDDKSHNGLLREDQTCAACALETFALIAKDNAFPQKVKVKLLQMAAKNAGNAFDTLQLCVTAYLSIGETESAMALMRMLVNEGYNIDLNAQLLSMQYVGAYCNGSIETAQKYLTLAERVDESVPLFPMPKSDSDKGVLTDEFMQEQYKYVFNEYSGTVSEYIIQCVTAYNRILSMSGDVSAEIIDFIQNVEKDITELFDENVAQQMQDKIMADMRKVLNDDSNRDALTNQIKRSKNSGIAFENVFKNAFIYIAEVIERYIEGIKSKSKEYQMKKVSEYTGRILLFKKRKKIYGTAISKSIIPYERDPFKILRTTSEESQTLQKCKDVIEKFLNEDELFVIERKKETAKFYTTKESADLSDYLSSKKGIPNISIIIGVLDTKSKDLVFTTTGIVVPRKFHETKEVPYGAIRMDRGDIVIGNIKFNDSEVNNSALERLINALTLQSSVVHNDNCLTAFKQKLAKCAI